MNIFRIILFIAAIAVSAATGACGMDGSIQQVKEQHTTELMALPGVVSVGLGKNKSGEPAIIVGVETDSAESISAVPKRLDGYPVEVQVMGKVSAQ